MAGETLVLRDRLRAHTDSHTLERALATGAYEGLRAALDREPSEIIEEVKASGLRGRGGAGFPTGRKWSFLPSGDAPRHLVVNGDEGEPGTFKDRELIERDPHQLIEGVAIASWAIGCRHAFVYVRGEFAVGQERLTRAVRDAEAAGLLGDRVMGTDFDLRLTVSPGAGAYICGEETALLESLEGQRGMPRIRPPFPAVKGLYQRPTVVNNVETISNLPWIARHGGDAFAEMGEGRSTGTRVFSLSGRVNRPGNFELELGHTTFRDLIEDPDLGGGVIDGGELAAFVPGGASAPWFGPDGLDCPLDFDEVQERGSMLGSGAVIVLDDRHCPVRAALRLVRFFAHESCGKCTPCREGTDWLVKVMRRIEGGAGRRGDLDMLLDVCQGISPGLSWPPVQTTICPLGPSAVPPISSSLDLFRDDYIAHVDQHRCPHA